MRIKKLNELKNAYKPYADCWSTWIQNGNSSLNDFDLYVMETHIANGFKVVNEKLAMFFYWIEVTQRLIKKLKDKRQLHFYGNFSIGRHNKKYMYQEDG